MTLEKIGKPGVSTGRITSMEIWGADCFDMEAPAPRFLSLKRADLAEAECLAP